MCKGSAYLGGLNDEDAQELGLIRSTPLFSFELGVYTLDNAFILDTLDQVIFYMGISYLLPSNLIVFNIRIKFNFISVNEQENIYSGVTD